MSDQELLRFLQRMIPVLLFQCGLTLLVFMGWRAARYLLLEHYGRARRARLERVKRYLEQRALRRLRK